MSKRIEGWEDWPNDVVQLLRAWNREWRLRFPNGHSGFTCSRCENRFDSNRYGDAALDGKAICDDCLIALARRSDVDRVLI